MRAETKPRRSPGPLTGFRYERACHYCTVCCTVRMPLTAVHPHRTVSTFILKKSYGTITWGRVHICRTVGAQPYFKIQNQKASCGAVMSYVTCHNMTHFPLSLLRKPEPPPNPQFPVSLISELWENPDGLKSKATVNWLSSIKGFGDALFQSR